MRRKGAFDVLRTMYTKRRRWTNLTKCIFFDSVLNLTTRKEKRRLHTYFSVLVTAESLRNVGKYKESSDCSMKRMNDDNLK